MISELNHKEIKQQRRVFNKTDITTVAAFKVLSDLSRYRIFRLLADEPSLSVSNIAQILGISLPSASQHLKILVQANILQKKRLGKEIYPKLHSDNPFVKVIERALKTGLHKNKIK